MSEDKLNLLKKALGSETGAVSFGRPSMEPTSPAKELSKLSLSTSKFGSQSNNTGHKGANDPKGKNQQILKGNSKSKHKR